MARSYEELKRLDHAYLWHPFTQMREWLGEEPCIIERGEGHYLVDTEGKKYLDGVSSLWCNVHGHRKAELDEALTRQLGQVAHKMALQYAQLAGESSRTGFASLAEAYHGDTTGSMSVGYAEAFHRFHRSMLFPALRLSPPHIFRYYRGMGEAAALDSAIQEAEAKLAREKDALAALIIEPLMQGAAGMWAQPAAYVAALHKICRDNRILFIADEVATGFGRTGRMFACEHAGVSPDILCVAKGITGGYLPLAATLATEEIFSAFLGEYKEFKAFFHGHTYTGNPLASAVALASLELFQSEEILARMEPKIDYLKRRLEEEFRPLAHVADIRRWGFMLGIELAEDKETRKSYPAEQRTGHKVILEARRRGVMIRPLGDVIVLMPPLTIGDGELKMLLDVVYESIRAVTES